jgi:peptidoglycan/xylan/chitin deacetylase (PgdA/CDA1 family)
MSRFRLGASVLAGVCTMWAASAQAQTACPGNANALGVSRTVEIDTTGGPGFGMEHYKAHDFLLPQEVILTFDDGPWPTTPQVLAALAAHCTKATFFAIGKNAIAFPEVMRQVVAGGHTIGTHTWSHMMLAGKGVTPDKAKEEIEKGFSAVKIAMGQGEPASFFRFPGLKGPDAQITYLGQRNVAIFSTDIDSFDFKFRKPDQVVKSVMERLEKRGKGIVLLHDFQKHTAAGTLELLNQMKAKGYKIVHMRPKNNVTTLAEFDEKARAEFKAPPGDTRPTSTIVRTVPPAK